MMAESAVFFVGGIMDPILEDGGIVSGSFRSWGPSNVTVQLPLWVVFSKMVEVVH